VDNLLKQFAQSSPLNGGSAAYVEDLYEQYLVSPDSVDPKWKAFFDGFKGREAGDVPHSVAIEHITQASRQAANAANGAAPSDERERHVGRLITAYRSRGHLGARLDPLGLSERSIHRTWAWNGTPCPSATWTANSAPAGWPASRAWCCATCSRA